MSQVWNNLQTSHQTHNLYEHMNISQYVSDTPPPPSHPLTTLDSFYIQSISARLISTPSTLHQQLLRPQWTFQWQTKREMNDLYRDQTLHWAFLLGLSYCNVSLSASVALDLFYWTWRVGTMPQQWRPLTTTSVMIGPQFINHHGSLPSPISRLS